MHSENWRLYGMGNYLPTLISQSTLESLQTDASRTKITLLRPRQKPEPGTASSRSWRTPIGEQTPELSAPQPWLCVFPLLSIRPQSGADHRMIDPVLNAVCRAISGCLRPTRVDDLYLLCGIAPPPYQTGNRLPAWGRQTRKLPSASSLWARSSQRETKIKTQLLLNPLIAAPTREEWPSGPATSRQPHTSSH